MTTETTALDSKQLLQRADDGPIIRLRLNRPDRLNCLSEELLAALQAEFDSIGDNQIVKCVILEGAGRAFCAGHDLKQIEERNSEAYIRDLFTACTRMMLTIHRLPVPVIAKVHGDATAAGCQLMSTCDMAIASSNARFATAGINLGSYCATPAVPLTRRVPSVHSFDMLVTGRLIDANTAADWGLINKVVPPEQLDDAVDELAAVIASKSGQALRFAKSQIYTQRAMDLDSAYRFAIDGLAKNMSGDEAREGINAFLNKRAPNWKY